MYASRPFSLLLALLSMSAAAGAQREAPEELQQLVASLADRAEAVDSVSFTLLEISGDGEGRDTFSSYWSAMPDVDNDLNIKFKALLPGFNAGVALQGELLTFYSFADSTYTQYDLSEDGYGRITGSPLSVTVEHLPFGPDYMHPALLQRSIDSFTIDSTDEVVRVQVAYTDSEYIQQNRSEYRFDRRTGLLRSSVVTYTDGITNRREEVLFTDPRPNEAFEAVDLSYLPDPSRFSPSPEPSAPQPELNVGDTLPNFTTVVGGLELPEDDYELYLVDLWYFACAPCQKLSPLIEQVYRAKHDGLAVFGLNLFDPVETVRKYQQLKGITFPSYVGLEDRDDYLVNSFPTVYLLDSSGKILDRVVGYEEDFIDRITPLIESYLSAEGE